jgi:hypothetical protein
MRLTSGLHLKVKINRTLYHSIGGIIKAKCNQIVIIFTENKEGQQTHLLTLVGPLRHHPLHKTVRLQVAEV